MKLSINVTGLDAKTSESFNQIASEIQSATDEQVKDPKELLGLVREATLNSAKGLNPGLVEAIREGRRDIYTTGVSGNMRVFLSRLEGVSSETLKRAKALLRSRGESDDPEAVFGRRANKEG